MSKNLIKPVENEDFGDARNPKCHLLGHPANPISGPEITPPLYLVMPAGPKSLQNSWPGLEGGGVISNSSDR